jgi:tRNA threonylcarbamoyladenosine biosynthesis protein TsaB
MILLIDTSQEIGTVAIESDGKVLFSEENKIAKEHAAWLHSAIGRILNEAKMALRELEAIAVVAGPGSYTGLRVAMAAAKGFCYALKIPLITQNTLRVMAGSMKETVINNGALICPMIDARRDEVFTALFTPNDLPPTANRQPPTANAQPPTANRQPLTANRQPPSANDLTEILPPQALILDKNSFEKELTDNPIVFFGSGAIKWKEICISPVAIFEPQPAIIHSFAQLARQDFIIKNLADPVYSEPVYLKEFFSY